MSNGYDVVLNRIAYDAGVEGERKKIVAIVKKICGRRRNYCGCILAHKLVTEIEELK